MILSSTFVGNKKCLNLHRKLLYKQIHEQVKMSYLPLNDSDETLYPVSINRLLIQSHFPCLYSLKKFRRNYIIFI